MKYNLIVPPNSETATTGLLLAGEKTVIRGGKEHTYRVEAYRSGVRCIRDGIKTPWDEFSHVGRTLAHEVAAKVKEIAALNSN